MDSNGQPFNSQMVSQADLTQQSNDLAMSAGGSVTSYFTNGNLYGAPPHVQQPSLEQQAYATPYFQDYSPSIYGGWNDPQVHPQLALTHRRGYSASSTSGAHMDMNGRGRGISVLRGRGGFRGNNLTGPGRGISSREGSAVPQPQASSPTSETVFRTSPSPYMQAAQLPMRPGSARPPSPALAHGQAPFVLPGIRATVPMNPGGQASHEMARTPQREVKALPPSHAYPLVGAMSAPNQHSFGGDPPQPVGKTQPKTRSPLPSVPDLPKSVNPTVNESRQAGASPLSLGSIDAQPGPVTYGSDSEHSSSDEDNDAPSVDKARYPRGPRNAKSKDRINEALSKVIEIGNRTAAEEKVPPEHFWSKLTTDVSVNKTNSFNLFEKVVALELSLKKTKFFDANPTAVEDDSRCPKAKPKAEVLEDYNAYKKKTGDGLHQRLQNKIARLEGKAVQAMRFRKRQSAFDKTWANLTDQLNHASAVFGFESVILFSGNLAVDLFPDMCKIHETPGAKEFISEKVGKLLTALQSYFRSHILNINAETQIALERMPPHADLEGVEWPLRLTSLDTSKPWSQPALETAEAGAMEYTESTPLDVLKQAVYTVMESMQQSFVVGAPPEVEKVLRGNTGSGVTYHAWLSWLTVLSSAWGQYNVEYVLVNWPLSVRPPSRPEEIRLSQLSSKEYLNLIHAFKAGKGPVVRLRRPEDDPSGIVFGQNAEVLVTRDGKRTVTSQDATVISGGPKGLKASPAARQTRSHSTNTPSALPGDSPAATTPGGAQSTVEAVEAPLVPRLPQVVPVPKKKPAKQAPKTPATGGKAAKSASSTAKTKKAKGTKAARGKSQAKKAVEEDVEMDEADEDRELEDMDEMVEEEERYDHGTLEAEGLAVVAEPRLPSARTKRGADTGINATSASESQLAKRVKIEQEQAERNPPRTPPPPTFNLQEPTPSALRVIAQFPQPSAINPQLLAIPQPPTASAASPPAPSPEQESSADYSAYTWEPECQAFLRNDLEGEEMRSIWTDPTNYRLAISYGWVPFDLDGFDCEGTWVPFEFE